MTLNQTKYTKSLRTPSLPRSTDSLKFNEILTRLNHLLNELEKCKQRRKCIQNEHHSILSDIPTYA